jgi:predicted metal-dependent hydrolase
MSTAVAKRKQLKRTSRSKEQFKSRVREWALKLDVKVKWITVRPMSNKWASCSTAGKLNFNSELLRFDSDVADYVIVHELLHFFVPNHGKLWKSLMRAHLGDYESLDNRLRQRGL